MLRYKVSVTGFLFLLAILAGVPATVNADGGTPGVIHACVRPNGIVRIVNANALCGPNEIPLHWPASAISAAAEVTESTDVNTDSPKDLQVNCPAGTGPIRGGAQILPAPYVPGVILQTSAPVGTSYGPYTSWLAVAWANLEAPYAWGLRVDVLCGVQFGYYYGASLMGPVRPLLAWSSLALVAGLVASQLAGWRTRRD